MTPNNGESRRKEHGVCCGHRDGVVMCSDFRLTPIKLYKPYHPICKRSQAHGELPRKGPL